MGLTFAQYLETCCSVTAGCVNKQLFDELLLQTLLLLLNSCHCGYGLNVKMLNYRNSSTSELESLS